MAAELLPHPAHLKRRHTILIVDDDAGLGLFLANLLEHAGYDTAAICSVPHALEMMQQRAPDLLITDVRVAGRNGLSLLIMGPQPPVPAIVITGFVDETIEREARRLGAEFLLKPFDSQTLCAMVARRLGAAPSS